MPERTGELGSELQSGLEAVMTAHPELNVLTALVLVMVREAEPSERGISTALLARRLGIEHALVRRAAAELDTGGWVTTMPVNGASPALRLFARKDGGEPLPPQ